MPLVERNSYALVERMCLLGLRMGLVLWIFRLPVPRLDQGLDSLLKKQFKLCSQGEIGWIASQYVISALPEQDKRPIKTNRKVMVNRWEREEEETRRPPTTRRQLEHMHSVFRTNLLMAMLPFPSLTKLGTGGSGDRTWRTDDLSPVSRSCCSASKVSGGTPASGKPHGHRPRPRDRPEPEPNRRQQVPGVVLVVKLWRFTATGWLIPMNS